MRLITWNCNMAFRKKAASVLRYQPDILVIPECEHPSRLSFGKKVKVPSHSLWFGQNPNKGLGIFSFGDYKLQVEEHHKPEFRTIVPISILKGRKRFSLYAIWAYNPQDKNAVYVEQIWKALAHYDHLISGRRILMAGDFNSNTIWDKKNRVGNHSHVVEKLASRKIMSTYHEFHQQEQGKEKHPTFMLYRHKDKPYHIDYCFASRDLIKKLGSVEVGKHRYWKKLSDHVPLIVTFND